MPDSSFLVTHSLEDFSQHLHPKRCFGGVIILQQDQTSARTDLGLRDRQGMIASMEALHVVGLS